MSKALVLITKSNLSDIVTIILPFLKTRYVYDQQKESLYVETFANEEFTNYISIHLMKEMQFIAEDYIDRDDVPIEFQEDLLNLNPNFFLVNYNDLESCNIFFKNFLSSTTENLRNIWFDNDYADIISGETVLRKLQSSIKWDWLST
jgi:hypothetical protein